MTEKFDARPELAGKRLLVLGGSLWKSAIKQFCSGNGVTIVAAGNDPHAGICDISDEYYNVDSTDQAVMKDLIRMKRIDGVYLGGSEPVISAGSQYVNEMGLPCFCNKTQWEALQNKCQLKLLFKEFGLPVTQQYTLDEAEDGHYPLVVKPADGCGSSGFSICRSPDELEQVYRNAAHFSPTGSVIIEKFVPNTSVVVFYAICNGELVFLSLEDKYSVSFKAYGTYVGGLFDFESGFSESFRREFEERIQKLVDHLEIKNGSFWIEVFLDSDQYYFNEAGFRYGGSGSIYPIDYFRNINLVAADIYFSLTGKGRISGFSSLYGEETQRERKYAVYPLFLKEGIIGSVDGLKELYESPNILTVLEMKRAGDTICGNGSFGQAALLVHFVYKELGQLRNSIQNIHRILRITDEKGQNMILTLLNSHELELRTK